MVERGSNPLWKTSGIFDEWAGATATGILTGMVYGGYTGSAESSHLRHELGTFQNLRNKSYKVPLNVVHACNKAATYGWKFGFFAGAFAGTRQALAMLLPDYTRQARETLGRSADENYRAVGDALGHRLFEETAPTAGAGTLVGTLYGAASGGLKGGILGCIYAFGASTFAGLCMTGTRMASEWVEEEIERSERARNAHLIPTETRADEMPDTPGEWEESRGDLLAMLEILRKREKAEGVDLSRDKAEVKRIIKVLPKNESRG